MWPEIHLKRSFINNVSHFSEYLSYDMKNCTHLNLGQNISLSPFISQILDYICWTDLDLFFWCRDSENQKLTYAIFLNLFFHSWCCSLRMSRENRLVYLQEYCRWSTSRSSSRLVSLTTVFIFALHFFFALYVFTSINPKRSKQNFVHIISS